MKTIHKVLVLTLFYIFSVFSGIAQTTKKKDLSPPWYKRFVGKIGNENGIIHIQKSYKNAVIIIYIAQKSDIRFSDSEINFAVDKIEAERRDYTTKESTILRCELQGNTLSGVLVLPNNTSLPINAEENYTQATRLKLYEYSQAEKIKFEGFAGVPINYSYRYHLNIIPEYAVQDFEKTDIGVETSRKSSQGLKGEIKALEREQYLTNESYEKITYNQNDILITEHGYYFYEGGAHGMYGSSYTHYDLQNKKIIRLEDLLTSQYKTVLAPILLKKARELNISLLSDTVEPTENFLLSSTAITFLYQPYEIASYADGIVEIPVSYQEIKEILKPSSFLERIKR